VEPISETQLEATDRRSRDGASQLAPSEPRQQVEDLLHKSYVAPDAQDALVYAQRAVDLLPDDPRVLDSVQRSMVEHLSQDAFIAFVKETDDNYIISLRNSRPLQVPKARAAPEVYPPSRLTPGERTLGLIRWMTLGLIPVGLGALILCPFVLMRAIQLLGQPSLKVREERRAWLAIALATGLGFLGAIFALLLALHVGG
jgi:hypothetical protein